MDPYDVYDRKEDEALQRLRDLDARSDEETEDEREEIIVNFSFSSRPREAAQSH